MKKNVFKHVSLLLTGAVLLSLAFVGCQKDIKTKVGEENLLARPGGGGNSSLTAVPLRVTIEAVEGANITSDGNNYVHNQQNVKAIIDEHGNLLFNTQLSSTKPVQRSFVYNFNDPVESTNDYRVQADPSKLMTLNMIKSNFQPSFVALQSMTVGNPQCVGLGGGFYDGNSRIHHISFHRSLEDTESSPTAYAVVTRTKIKSADGVDEWIVESAGECSSNSDVASLRSGSGTRKDPTIVHGYYRMPFKLILTAIQ